MFLHLKHTKLAVYDVARKLLIACYKLANKFPTAEQFNLIFQVKKTALSVLLKLAEGSSRKSPKERTRFYEVSRSSAVEIDAAFDGAFDLKYVTMEDMNEAGRLLLTVFRMLSNMINPGSDSENDTENE